MFFFFFKQKTAYEIYQCDWSSDVCSSDLLPPLNTKKGELVNAVYGFLLAFLKAVREFQPDFVAAAFDFPAPTFRHKKFKEYKAKRLKMPEELRQQFPKIKKILESFNVPIFEKEKFEADDIIGTIAKAKKKASLKLETIMLVGEMYILYVFVKITKSYYNGRESCRGRVYIPGVA